MEGGLFPACRGFQWQTIPEGCDPHPTFEISDLDFEMDVYKPPESYKSSIRSFLSVPLKSTRKNGYERVFLMWILTKKIRSTKEAL